MLAAVFTSAGAAKGSDHIFWQHRFAAAEPETDGFITSIIPLRSGGFLLAGSIKFRTKGSAELVWHPWVLRLDSGGGVIWERRISIGRDDASIAAAAPLHDGGVIVVGYRSKNRPGIGKDSWAASLRADGGLAWQETLRGAASNGFKAALPLPNGHVLIAGGENEAVYEGTRELVSDESEAPRLVVLDAGGHVLREQHFRDAKRVTIASLHLQGNHRMALGTRWGAACMPFLVGTAASSQALLPKPVDCPVELDGGNDEGVAVAYRTAASRANSYPRDQLGVRRLSWDGTTKWEWHGDPRPGTSPDYFSIDTLRVRTDGADGAVVALSVSSAGPVPQANAPPVWLLRFSGAGRRPQFWALDHGTPGSRASTDIDAVAAMPNGTVAIAGRSLRHDDSPQRIYLDVVAWLMLVETGGATALPSVSPSK